MSPTETKVLRALAEHFDSEYGDGCCFMPFLPLMQETRLPRHQVRRACRSLRRKGLAEFSIGLWNDDGEPAGAGYAATKNGMAALEALAKGECGKA